MSDLSTREQVHFRSAWWLPGAHLQTVWGQVARSRRLITFEREAIETPDGDELILDHIPGAARSPRLLLLHGLEGSSFSTYAQGIVCLARARGWRATILNFRSCARDPHDTVTWIPNRRPRLYHSGETTDLDLVASTLHGREPDTPLVAVGVSLGGNVLLKWLGENPQQTTIQAAATISVPYDLAAGARNLESRIGQLYTRHFLVSLQAKLEYLAGLFPEIPERVDIEAARRARSFFSFDDAATAPLHGFAGAEDYYARSSSVRFVERITTPTLCVSAEDDPFLPADVLARLREHASSSIQTVFPGTGGHVGFITGWVPTRPTYWAEQLVVGWLAARLNGH